MKISLLLKAIAIPLGFSLFLLAAIIHSGGVAALSPFANIESLAIVWGGTLLLVWMAFPAAEAVRALMYGVACDSRIEEREAGRFHAILQYCSSCALWMGFLSTSIGLILFLNEVADISKIPRYLAFAFTGLFQGLYLSQVIFEPLVRRISSSTAAQ